MNCVTSAASPPPASLSKHPSVMRWSMCLILAVLLGFLPCQILGQQSQAPVTTVAPNSSPVLQTAQLIGITAEMKQLEHAPGSATPGSPELWQILWLRQRVLERVTAAQLEVDATVAQIDNEIARAAEVHGFLADRRDRVVNRANLLAALIGGGLSATSAGLQLSTAQNNAAVATGIAGGAVSAGLAAYGIHAERGGVRALGADSNMLAAFFDRPELPTSHYSGIVWTFLNSEPASDPDHLTRRQQLMKTWLELKRLDPPPDTTAGRTKIEHVTSMPEQHLMLTIDDLEDRVAMLEDVRAKLSFLKRDLAALLSSLPDVPADSLRPGAP